MLLTTLGCYLTRRRLSNLCFYINIKQRQKVLRRICDAHVNFRARRILSGVQACVFLRPTVHSMSSSLGSSSYSVLITVIVRSKARTLFNCSDTWTAGSNSTRCMDYLHFPAFVLSYVGTGLPMGRSRSKEPFRYFVDF
jgi:hypothetical protein